MIHVLLTSELPWQHNDPITFFAFVFLGSRGFFQKSLKGACTSLSCLGCGKRFEQIIRERFGSILKQSSKDPKNSE